MLDALGSCYFGLENYEKSLEMYSFSLSISEKAYGAGSYETADTIQQQGKCLVALDRLDESVAMGIKKR